MTSPVFENISIVLVEPRSPGNVGSVARAMKNTGFRDLVLVNPCDYANNESFSMACNAVDILRKARVAPTLGEAASGSKLIVGTTRRLGKLRYPVFTLTDAAPRVLEMSRRNSVSIVFGREDKGLKNEETGLCDILLEIPTHRDYPSLNLSHAVLLVCHELFRASGQGGRPIELAPRVEVETMYAHMEEALKTLEYGEKGGRHLLEAIMRNMKRLLGRAGLTLKEVNMLRGIFTQIIQRCGSGGTFL